MAATRFTLALALALLWSTSALAQEWLVMPANVDGEQPDVDASTELARALGGPSDDAAVRERLNAVLGEVPRAVTDGDVSQLQVDDEDVLITVAEGRDDEAIQKARVLLDRVTPEIASYGRRAEASTAIGNICLYAVRATLHRDDPDTTAADTIAAECVTLIPDLVPDRRQHPPMVIAAVGRVRARLEQGSPTLAIRGTGSDCAIRVNGRRVGETPRVDVHAPAGPAFVQVECGSTPGRARRVDLTESGRERVDVDAELLRALETSDGLVRLRYATTADLERLAPGHAERLAQLVDRTHGVAVHRQGDTVRALGPSRASAPAGDRDALERVAAALQSGEALDVAGGEGGNRLRAPAMAAFIVSGVALVAAGVFSGLALAERRDKETLCASAYVCTADDVAKLDRLALVADLSWGVSLGAFAVGLTLALLGRSSMNERLALVPWTTGSDSGILVRGRF